MEKHDWIIVAIGLGLFALLFFVVGIGAHICWHHVPACRAVIHP